MTEEVAKSLSGGERQFVKMTVCCKRVCDPRCVMLQRTQERATQSHKQSTIVCQPQAQDGRLGEGAGGDSVSKELRSELPSYTEVREK